MDQGVSKEDILCLEILEKNNYYEILGINNQEKIENIKKAYKSKALKIHPDKNKSIYAREAFQKLSKAFVCLSSEVLRKVYDATGSEELANETIFQKFDENFADKVFSDVLSDFQAEPNSQIPIYKTQLAKFLFLQLFPVILILFLCIYTSNVQNSSEFSFTISPHYNLRKVVRPQNVMYFVNSDYFRELNSSQIEKLEKKVIHYYENKDKIEEIAQNEEIYMEVVNKDEL